MSQNASIAPDRIFTVHPGGGNCGLNGLKLEGFSFSTGQYIYRCTCGFRWYLFISDISQLLQSVPRLDER